MSEFKPSNIIEFASFKAPSSDKTQKEYDFEAEAELLAESLQEPFMVESPYWFLRESQPTVVDSLEAANRQQFNSKVDSSEAWQKVLYPNSNYEVKVLDFDLINHELLKDESLLNAVIVKFSAPSDENSFQYYEIPLVDILPIFEKERKKYEPDLTLADFFKSNHEILNHLHRYMFLLKNRRNSKEEADFYSLVDESGASHARVFRYSVNYS